MKTIIIILALLIGTISYLQAQATVDRKKMVGFACYYRGQPSKPVEKVTQKLESKNYKSIAKMLNSRNNAERYLAVVILEKLSKLNQYKISEREYEKIAEIKGSNEKVSVCSGCTYFRKVELSSMFTSEMKSFPENWLNRTLNQK